MPIQSKSSFRIAIIILLPLIVLALGLSSLRPATAAADSANTIQHVLGVPTPSRAITLTVLGTYHTGVFDAGAAEIVAFDAASERGFVVNGATATVDILDVSDPVSPTLISQIDVTLYGGSVNSVAAHDGVVVAAVANVTRTLPGAAVFFDTDGTFISQVTVGALPDMVTFTPDGNSVLVANEGEPSDDYLTDPEGSISIIDISGGVAGLMQSDVMTADFATYNDRIEELRARGVRIYGPGASTAQDMEPEYIAVSPDGSTAFATLQENNALAVIDIASATVEDILPLGFKDHSQGPASLSTYEFDNLPTLGTTAGGQDILLGGLSGLWFEGMSVGGNYQFVTIPDRGPNGAPTDVDSDGEDERPFALPEYQARVIRFELNPTSGDIMLTEQISLTRSDGVTPITGLPNIPDVDEEPVDLFGNLLPYDEMGADMEGIVVAADNSFWMVDEYRPAIYHFDDAGQLIGRFVPTGTAALAGQPVGTFGDETLPEAYSSRRANRGFEGMALDTDSGILYAFIQTPLANPDRPASDNSNIIRMLGIDPATGIPVAEYVYLLEKADYGTSLVDKIGDAVYAGDGKFYVIERDSATSAVGKKFIFEIDLSGATNVLTHTFGMSETLEQQTADDLIGMNIYPVHKRKVTNLPSLGYLAGDKPEGLALLPDGRLAVLNDNDFGLLDEEIPGDGTIALNPEPVPVVLGLISFETGNRLDASNQDGGITLQNWPVLGMYQPDSIASFMTGGMTYYVTANEGDARDYGGYSEEERIGGLVLDTAVFSNAAFLQDNANLGRLNSSTVLGDLDRDGDYDQLYSYGARSFSIWDAYGNLVYDSSDDFEQITAAMLPDDFNSNNDANGSFDSRSDDKGPEPEAIAIGGINGRTYAFIGLERIGGIMVYDVTDPHAPTFVQYLNNRDFSGDPTMDSAGDLGPEGIIFVASSDSPTGQPLLLVANEISGSTTIYRIEGGGSTIYVPVVIHN